MKSQIQWRKSIASGVIFSAIGFAVLWQTSKTTDTPAKNAFPLISCIEMDYIEQLNKQPGKLRAGSDVGGMGRFHYEITYPEPPPGVEPEKRLIHPNIAIPAFNGWLLGGNRGEFGGELVFQKEERGATPQIVNHENIEDIYKMPFGFIATVGLSHMGSDKGAVLLIEQARNHAVNATKLFALPGAPLSSWPLRSNDILVKTNSGYFVVTKGRQLKQVACKEGTEDGT